MVCFFSSKKESFIGEGRETFHEVASLDTKFVCSAVVVGDMCCGGTGLSRAILCTAKLSLKPLSPEWWEAREKKKITLRWRTCLPFTGMRVISVEDHRFYEHGGL